MLKYFSYNIYLFVIYIRHRLLSLLSTSSLAKKSIVEACSKSPLFFIELFCLLPYVSQLPAFSVQHQIFKHQRKKDQRSGTVDIPAAVPFIPLRFQTEYIKSLVDKIEKGEPLLAKKSSATGTTTCTALVFLWFFLFRENSNFLIMTPSLFELYTPKLRNPAKIPIFNLLLFVIKHLPFCHLASPDKVNQSFPLPIAGEGRVRGINQQSQSLFTEINFRVNRKKTFWCCLENTSNGNRIIGLSSGKRKNIPDILDSLPSSPRPLREGAGGGVSNPQLTSIYLDDLAFHSHADYHYPQLQQLSTSLICASSFNGTNNLFYDLTRLKTPINTFVMSWILNPLCDRNWYDNLCKLANANFVAQFINQCEHYRYKYPVIQKASFKVDQNNNVILSTAKNLTNEANPLDVIARNSDNSDDVAIFPNDNETNKQDKLDLPVHQRNISKPPVLSCITNLKRRPHKNFFLTRFYNLFEVKQTLIKCNIPLINLPFLDPAKPRKNNIILNWHKLNQQLININNVTLDSAKAAVEIVNQFSEKRVSGLIIPRRIEDLELPFEFRSLFYNDSETRRYLLDLNEQRLKQEQLEREEREREEINRPLTATIMDLSIPSSTAIIKDISDLSEDIQKILYTIPPRKTLPNKVITNDIPSPLEGEGQGEGEKGVAAEGAVEAEPPGKPTGSHASNTRGRMGIPAHQNTDNEADQLDVILSVTKDLKNEANQLESNRGSAPERCGKGDSPPDQFTGDHSRGEGQGEGENINNEAEKSNPPQPPANTSNNKQLPTEQTNPTNNVSGDYNGPLSRAEIQRRLREARRLEKLQQMQNKDGKYYPKTTGFDIQINQPDNKDPNKPDIKPPDTS